MSVRLREDADMMAEGLDSLFDAARAATPPDASGLMARVLADAYVEQDARAAQVVPAAPVRKGWRTALVALLSPGNGRAAAGLLAATLAGVWIGFVQPAPVAGVSQALEPESVDVVELIPDLDTWLAEG